MYGDKLRSIELPFKRWHETGFEVGLEQYTKENCQKAESIFSNLIDKLVSIGESATEEQKLELFQSCVEALNSLNEELDDCFIETGEREDLCELVDEFTKAVGLDPKNYADGAGLADLWRDW